MTLSTLEIAQLRADQADYWPDTCTIQTRTNTADGQGGFTVTWANTYTSVACRLAPEQGRYPEEMDDRTGAAQFSALTVWVLTVAHNQAIDETMRVVHDSETYEITQLEDTHSNRTAKRAHLRRLD